MAAAVKKRLRIFAGPNGSGKSTITKIVLDYGDRNLSPVILSSPCHPIPVFYKISRIIWRFEIKSLILQALNRIQTIRSIKIHST